MILKNLFKKNHIARNDTDIKFERFYVATNKIYYRIQEHLKSSPTDMYTESSYETKH